MNRNMVLGVLFSAMAAVCLALPYAAVETFVDWEQLLMPISTETNLVRPMSSAEWGDYMKQSMEFTIEGEPYPSTTFIPADLYVSYCTVDGGGAGGCVDNGAEAGLVMTWGKLTMPEGEYASAWVFQYGEDPDLSNCILSIDVEAPCGMQQISIGLQDANGNIRAWYWNVGVPGQPSGPGVISCSPSPAGIPNRQTITIDLTMQGLGASNPPAFAYMSNPAFDITKVVQVMFDENMKWVAGTVPPPPGGQIPKPWNYWFNLRIYPKGAYKTSYVKFAQLPSYIATADHLIYGWDMKSIYSLEYERMFMAADDWVCRDSRPVTDIHWWGSFIGWTKPYLPPQIPSYFLICIWKDVPAGTGTQFPWSSPGLLVWMHKCDNWVWNFAGYDKDPRWEYPEYDREWYGPAQRNEACFQFNQLLSEPDYFRQQGPYNVYWISIAAVYEGFYPDQIQYPWGWKTKPHEFQDVAGIITGTSPWVLTPNSSVVTSFFPLVLPHWSMYPDPLAGKFDLAFELTTNVKPKCHTLAGDLNHDCVVNLNDFSIFAGDWLKTE